MTYPQFYLDGNIALQEAIENLQRYSIRCSLQWLVATAVMFVLLLTAVTFELPILAAFATLELLVCTAAVYLISDIPPQYQ